MSVEDWARRRAEDTRPAGVAPQGLKEIADYGNRRYARGIVHAFDAILSDEAIAASWSSLPIDPSKGDVRKALQAAINAVTKGGSDE